MSEKRNTAVAVICIDIGKNSFHIIGQDQRAALVPRQKWSRGQVDASSRTFAEAGVGARRESLRRDRGAGLSNKGCDRLMTIPGIGPLISSAIMAAIGTRRCIPEGSRRIGEALRAGEEG
jgi:hypothetical protein